MRKNVCFILVFLICFTCNIVLGKTFEKSIRNNGLINLENNISDICFFDNNGVKVVYSSDKDLQEEKNIIIEKIRQQNLENVIEEVDNEINVSNYKNEKIKVLLYKENNKTIVEEEIINYNSSKKLSELMQELTNLQTKYSKDLRYFQYIKGKINNKDSTIDKINSIREMKNINTLEIHNGYVGTANIYDGERVNFSVCTYNTGSYLVIGTPIIFTTY